MSASPSHAHASPIPPRTAHALSAAQAAAVAAAEAIAATAAAEVAAEAAVTAQAAVDAALAAAQAAAAKATEVAARAVLAAAAAAVEAPDDLTPSEQLTYVDGPAAAAAKVALCVRAVAAATSTAAREAAAVVAEQSASDVAATAAAVTFATRHPALAGEPPRRLQTPAEIPQASLIRAMHQNGASVLTIAASLNADGSRTVHGRRWSAKSVTQTLDAPTT